jgi:formylglycine-generating enzyme required for sulfatase activity
MTHATPTGSVEGRDIVAHTINTGHIERTTNLTINVITDNIDRLTDLLGQPGGTVRHAATGILEAVAGNQTLSLPADLLKGWELLRHAVDADADLRCRAYAAWLVTRRPQAPPQHVAARERYIPLAGRMGFEDVLLTPHFSERRWRGEGPQRQWERIPLSDVTQAVAQHPAFVLLGPPGCGKSTVLHRLALDTARAFLTGQGELLPLLITLAEYRWERVTPLEFVSKRWTDQAPEDFAAMARAGRVLLLADGLNEMLRLDSEGARRRANDWQRFIETYFADPHNDSRAVIASRGQADYDQPLGLPRVEIDPLGDEQIAEFLHVYLKDEAAGALSAIRRLDLLDHARNPYQLALLAELYDPQTGGLPPNRGLLFAEYARRLVWGERDAGHRWFHPEAALAALAELGFAMQARSESTVLPATRLQELLPDWVHLKGQSAPTQTPPGGVFNLACRARLLIPDLTAAEPDAYKFSHQLLQEQFAARRLLARWEKGDDLSESWRTPRTPRQMPPADVGEWDPLLPPPPSGWEQATILAAGIAGRPDAFVRAVLAQNPALAGRCLSEGAAPVSHEARTAVQQALLAEMSDPAMHRRARLHAGRVLGAVGDPRFTPRTFNGMQLIWPDLVWVAGGRATIGSSRWDRSAFENERPRHQVDIAPFYLGRTPVTNAEYECFIQAGGYDTEAYWTPAGWQWRHGKLETSGLVEDVLESRKYLLKNPDKIEEMLRQGRWMPEVADAWRSLVSLSEEEVRLRLLQVYPVRAHERPHYWDDPAYNAPNQPVVSVTWYEATAYCAWLTEQLRVSGYELRVWRDGKLVTRNSELAYRSPLGKTPVVRLPAEVEWEWAAGGPRHTPYPWGKKFDPEKANTLEGRVLSTSPVGAYPGGMAACGALDMSGNVWEWMSNLYRDYPYWPDDGREDPLAEGRRALRGGSWLDYQRNARVSSRTHHRPDNFDSNVGFRVLVAPV